MARKKRWHIDPDARIPDVKPEDEWKTDGPRANPPIPYDVLDSYVERYPNLDQFTRLQRRSSVSADRVEKEARAFAEQAIWLDPPFGITRRVRRNLLAITFNMPVLPWDDPGS